MTPRDAASSVALLSQHLILLSRGGGRYDINGVKVAAYPEEEINELLRELQGVRDSLLTLLDHEGSVTLSSSALEESS